MSNPKRIFYLKIVDLTIQMGLPLFRILYDIYDYCRYAHGIEKQYLAMTANYPILYRHYMPPVKIDTSFDAYLKSVWEVAPVAYLILIVLQLLSALLNSFIRNSKLQSGLRKTYNKMAKPFCICVILWWPTSLLILGHLGNWVWEIYSYGLVLFSVFLAILYIIIILQEISISKKSSTHQVP